jgi:ribosome-associated translation inhibitor RaiA
MPVRVLARGEALSAPEQRRLRQVSARLSRVFREVVELEWSLSREGRQRVAACKVHSRDEHYRARVSSGRFGASIDGALDRLLRQRRRRKSMTQTARKRGR